MSPARRARTWRERRLHEQGMAEMVGMVRGVVADGVVSASEAKRLREWTQTNPEITSRWPANLLTRRLERILRDGRVDGRERRRLRTMLALLAANPRGLAGGFALATDLPVTRPAPEVVFERRTYVFAGEMAYGPTRACEREVVELGGFCEPAVSRRTDYLVIGALASDWSQASFGSHVDDVVLHRARGATIAIITEEHWAAALP